MLQWPFGDNIFAWLCVSLYNEKLKPEPVNKIDNSSEGTWNERDAMKTERWVNCTNFALQKCGLNWIRCNTVLVV